MVRGSADKADPIGASSLAPAGVAARREALREFLEDWEAEHGALTPEELAKAEAELGLRTGEPEA